MSDQYMYLFVRTDLSTEQQIVQASHAANEAGKRFPDTQVSNIVLIGASGLEELM